jgi:hypothetical protein
MRIIDVTPVYWVFASFHVFHAFDRFGLFFHVFRQFFVAGGKVNNPGLLGQFY